ncbi:hypothetical protein EMPS_02861 [Entomortierella parvispora]|uniref:Arrestin C-terminal-like domain-containing protein n=1 Tax=Entomortierella parvispora TaxID=205924 RepID=A0A9P3H5M8_9FUNG|nr:hypothetical protein EMPS_02861 [Entomortierella parvispora]
MFLISGQVVPVTDSAGKSLTIDIRGIGPQPTEDSTIAGVALPTIIQGSPETPGYVEATVEFETGHDSVGDKLEIFFSAVVASLTDAGLIGHSVAPERIIKKRWEIPLTFQSEGKVSKGKYRRTVFTAIDPSWPSTMICPDGYVKYEFEALLTKTKSTNAATSTSMIIRTCKEFLVWNCNISQFASQRVGGSASRVASSSTLLASSPDLDRSSLSWKDPSALFPSPPTSPLTETSDSRGTATAPTGPRHSITGTWAKAKLPIVVSIPSTNVQLGETVPVTIRINRRTSTSGTRTGVVLVEGRIVIQQNRVSRSVHVGISPKKVAQKLITVPLPNPWPTQTGDRATITVEGTSQTIPVEIPLPSVESRARFSPTDLYPSLKSKYFDVEHQVSVILKLRLADQKDRQAAEVEISSPVHITNPRPAERAPAGEDWVPDYDDAELQRGFNRVNSRHHWDGITSRAEEEEEDDLPSYTEAQSLSQL